MRLWINSRRGTRARIGLGAVRSALHSRPLISRLDSPSRWRLAALLVVAAVFARGLTAGFVYDDLVLVERNPAAQHPFDLPALLLGPLFGSEQGYWRPLTSLVLVWGAALGGAPALHAVSLLLHLLVVDQLARFGIELGIAPRAAAAGALLFGVCPLVVEPVAWIAALNDPLWVLFGLLALRAHLRWRRSGSRGLPSTAAACLALALLTKENAIALGLLLPAVDLLRRRAAVTAPGALLRAGLLYAGIMIVWLVARTLVLGEQAAGAAAPVALAEPFLRRIEVAGRLLLALVLPLDPTPFAAPAPVLAVWNLRFLVPVAALLAFGLAVLVAARLRARLVLLAAAACVAVIAPVVAGLDAVGPYPIAARYLYPAAGIGALALASACEGRRGRVGLVVIVGAALALGVVSVVRVGVWQSQATLVAAALDRHGDDPRPHYMAARLQLEAVEQGDAAALPAAEQHLRTALLQLREPWWQGEAARQPLRADVDLGLAWCALWRAGRSPQPEWRPVVAEFARIAAAHPRLPAAQLGLGVALASANRIAAARDAFRRAIELEPRSVEAHVNLARALALLGDRAGARDAIDAALSLRPGDATLRELRARRYR